MEEVAWVDNPLNLKENEWNEWDKRNNKKLYRKSPNPIIFVVNFLLHNLCSDIYLWQNEHHHFAQRNGLYKRVSPPPNKPK
jgi:hypothetical protein